MRPCCSLAHDSWMGLHLPQPCTSCPRSSDQECEECQKQWTWLGGEPMLDGNNELIINKWTRSGSGTPEPNTDDPCGRLTTDPDWKNQLCLSTCHSENFSAKLCKYTTTK